MKRVNKETIEQEVLEDITRIYGNIEKTKEFQYNRTDIKFAIERAIQKTAKAIIDDTLGIICRDYWDYDPHHSGYSINKIDFDLLWDDIEHRFDVKSPKCVRKRK